MTVCCKRAEIVLARVPDPTRLLGLRPAPSTREPGALWGPGALAEGGNAYASCARGSKGGMPIAPSRENGPSSALRVFARPFPHLTPWNRASVQPRAITGPCGGASALRGQGETGTAGVSADRAPQSPACLVVPAAHEFLVSMCGHRSNETLNMPVEAPERLSGAFRAFTRERYTLGPESPSCALLGAFSGRLGGIAPSTLA